MAVIQSFKSQSAADLFAGKAVPRWVNIQDVAQRKLQMIHRAVTLHDLRAPPNNRLEALKGDRKGQHSVRINEQWRVCFIWRADGAHAVEIVDYH